MPRLPDRSLHAAAIMLAALLSGATSTQHDNNTPGTTKSAPPSTASSAQTSSRTGTQTNSPGFVMSHDVCAKHPNLKQCS